MSGRLFLGWALIFIPFWAGGLLPSWATEISGPWREKITERPAGQAAPVRPFRATFYFGWAGFRAGEAELIFRQPTPETYSAEVRGGTTGWPGTLWPMRATYHSIGTIAGWRTTRFTQREIYRRHTVDVQTRFVAEGVQSWRQRTPSPDRAQWRTVPLLGMRDILAAAFLVRSWPLPDGDTFRLLVFPGDAPYIADLRVEEREPLRWQENRVETVRLLLRLERIETRGPQKGTVRPHSRFREARIWLEDSGERRPLRAEAGIFIGWVFAELAVWEILPASQ